MGGNEVSYALPIVHSILSGRALMEVINALYDFSCISCRLLVTSTHDTYLLENEKGKRIVKVYSARTSQEDVLFEIELLDYLHNQGVLVSTAIPQKYGTSLFQIEAGEGQRQAVRFKYAKGRRVTLSTEDCYLEGGALAKIHSLSCDFTSSYSKSHIDMDYLVNQPLGVIASFTDSSLFAEYQTSAQHIKQGIQAYQTDLDWGVCHGDYGGNTNVDDDLNVTSYDFEACSFGWQAYDIAGFKWMIRNNGFSDSLWDSFIEGYKGYRAINDSTAKAIPYFVAAKFLWQTALLIENGDRWGYGRLDENWLHRRLSVLQVALYA